MGQRIVRFSKLFFGSLNERLHDWEVRVPTPCNCWGKSFCFSLMEWTLMQRDVVLGNCKMSLLTRSLDKRASKKGFAKRSVGIAIEN